MEYRWAVETATGEILYGHAAPYDCVPGLSPGQERVVTLAPVDARAEKWDGASVVPKSGAEIAAYDAAAQQTGALSLIDAPVTAAVLGGVFALVAEHGPGSGDEWSASDLRQHVIDTLTPLL